MSKQFPELKYINIGGGIGIKYRKEEELIDIDQFYGKVT
jgi:diaminopimelate decarboxylase